MNNDWKRLWAEYLSDLVFLAWSEAISRGE